MIANKEIEKLGDARVKLTVTINQEDAKKEYQKLLNTYAKKAQIKGFRKGKVPPAILEKKFGESIKAEAGQKIIEESMQEVFSEIEEKPLPYCVPELDETPAMDFENDFVYKIQYDIFPEINLEEYKGLEIEAPKIEVTEEDEKRELEAIVEQNTMVMEKEEDASAEKGDIVTCDFVELDEHGKEKEDTKREDFTFTLGTEKNLYRIDDDILGMQRNDEKIVTKEFPEDFDNQDLAGTTKILKITIKTIKERDVPELDDELAQDVNEEFETLDDLKKDIRERLERTAEAYTRQEKIQKLVEKVKEASTVEIPQSMLQAELDAMWNQFISRFQTTENNILEMLKAQGKDKESLFEEWTPSAKEHLKRTLLINKMIENEQIDANQEERDEYIQEQAENNNMEYEQLYNYYQKANALSQIEHELKEQKLFDELLKETKVKANESIKLLDAMKRNQ